MVQSFNKSLVVITWDGKKIPFHSVFFDASPLFKIILFNYSGIPIQVNQSQYHFDEIIHTKTECKGQVIAEVYAHLQKNTGQPYEYIGFVDDDLLIKISDINFMLHIARVNQLDAFQPSVYRDSFRSFRYNVTAPDLLLTYVNWVEIMSPFFRYSLLLAASEYLSQSISSYGIDCFAIPFFQKILGLNKTAVIHAVKIHHHQQITSGNKKYSNGLTAMEEGEKIRLSILQKVHSEYPYLLNDTKFMSEVLKYKSSPFFKIKNRYIKLGKMVAYLFEQVKIIFRRTG